jgi:hypothetical protein
MNLKYRLKYLTVAPTSVGILLIDIIMFASVDNHLFYHGLPYEHYFGNEQRKLLNVHSES